MQIRSLMVAFCTVTAATSSALAEPRYKFNGAQTAAIELSNLSSGGMCVTGQSDGRVVVVTYNARGTMPTGFTIEHSDGTRTFINIDEDEFQTASRLTGGWLTGCSEWSGRGSGSNSASSSAALLVA